LLAVVAVVVVHRGQVAAVLVALFMQPGTSYHLHNQYRSS
jgi:hypothetical protein